MSSLIKKALAGVTVALVLSALSVTALADGGQIGTVTADTLNVRQDPNTSAPVITQISKYGQVVVVDSTDGWYKISFGDTVGWVSSDYLSVEGSAPKATITGNNVNVRTGPGKGYDIVMTVVSGEKVNVLESNSGWSKVEFSTGVVGWVYDDYLSTGKSSVASRGSSLGSQIVSFAKKYMGTPYVYGGSSASGVDCSGFVKLVYNNFGIYVDRVAAGQASQGSYVSTSGLNEGDLVFFATGGAGYINHVGIYIGNGQFIHASSGTGSVTISSIWDSYYSSCFVTARTLIR